MNKGHKGMNVCMKHLVRGKTKAKTSRLCGAK